MKPSEAPELCECGHERGDHWHKAGVTFNCGSNGCECEQFIGAAAREPVTASHAALTCLRCERVITLAAPDCGRPDCDDKTNWRRLEETVRG
jgi:hypothetical protein